MIEDKEFLRLVAEMRRRQREYFRTRASGAMEEAKRSERLVDRAIQEATEQPRMFG